MATRHIQSMKRFITANGKVRVWAVAAAIVVAMQMHTVPAHAATPDLVPKAQASWFSGTVNPGAVQEWIWKNADPNVVYVPGLDPQGATTTTPCQFQVTRTWYVQQPTGKVEFHFAIQNVGTLACGANILLAWMTKTTSFATGGIGPGSSVTGSRANIPNLSAFQVGLVPQGATPNAACQLEITDLRYQQMGTDPRSLLFNLKNIGSIACSATVLLASRQAGIAATNVLDIGVTENLQWNNAVAGKVFFGGAQSIADPNATFGECDLQVTRAWYVQVINPPSEREFHYDVKNISPLAACNMQALLVAIS